MAMSDTDIQCYIMANNVYAKCDLLAMTQQCILGSI